MGPGRFSGSELRKTGSVTRHSRPTGKASCSGATRASWRIRDVVSGEVVRTLKGHEGTVSGVSLSPDGTRAVTGGFSDHQVLVWDLDSGLILHRMRHEGRVYAVQVLPDGVGAVTSALDDGTLRMWDLKTGRELRRMPPPFDDSAANLAVSPAGRLLLAGWHDRIWVWDLVAMQVVARLLAPEHRVYGLAFAPDGRRFVSTGWDDHTVRVWQLPSIGEPAALEEEEFLFPSRADLLWSVILSPDRRLLACQALGLCMSGTWRAERRSSAFPRPLWSGRASERSARIAATWSWSGEIGRSVSGTSRVVSRLETLGLRSKSAARSPFLPTVDSPRRLPRRLATRTGRSSISGTSRQARRWGN